MRFEGFGVLGGLGVSGVLGFWGAAYQEFLFVTGLRVDALGL